MVGSDTLLPWWPQVAAPTRLMERSSQVLPPLQSVREGLSNLKFQSEMPEPQGAPAATPEIKFRTEVAPTAAESTLRTAQVRVCV